MPGMRRRAPAPAAPSLQLRQSSRVSGSGMSRQVSVHPSPEKDAVAGNELEELRASCWATKMESLNDFVEVPSSSRAALVYSIFNMLLIVSLCCCDYPC